MDGERSAGAASLPLLAQDCGRMRVRLTANVGNCVVLVKLEPLSTLLFPGRKLPAGLGADMAGAAHPNLRHGRRLEPDEVRRKGGKDAVMPAEAPVAIVLYRPADSGYACSLRQLQHLAAVKGQPLAVYLSRLVPSDARREAGYFVCIDQCRVRCWHRLESKIIVVGLVVVLAQLSDRTVCHLLGLVILGLLTTVFLFYHDDARNLGQGSRVTLDVLKECSGCEEDGGIGWVQGAALMNAKDATIEDIVDPLRRQVTLLQEAETVANAAAKKVSIICRAGNGKGKR